MLKWRQLHHVFNKCCHGDGCARRPYKYGHACRYLSRVLAVGSMGGKYGNDSLLIVWQQLAAQDLDVVFLQQSSSQSLAKKK